jgi:hypothetical protein
MSRNACTDYWLFEQTEWVFDEIVYLTHMRTRDRVVLACLLPAAIGAVAGFGPLGLIAVMAYLWVVWTLVYEREVSRFLPAKAACFLMLVTYAQQPSEVLPQPE